MKKIIETILRAALALAAKKIIKKYQPKIVGITGSIGKTSSKEAVFSVLSTQFKARRNIKNYNNEIGVPLTIIGVESGGRSFLKWSAAFGRAVSLLIVRDENYPEVLVLEMGADKPGDIEYLVSQFPCDVGVITKIGPTHLEQFKTVEGVVREKQKIITSLEKSGVAVINADDPFVSPLSKRVKCRVVSFGYSESADTRAIDLSYHGEGLAMAGIKFKIMHNGSVVPVFLPGVVGGHQIYAALAAAAVGLAFNMNLIEISEGLKNYQPPKGRMNLIEGRGYLIIDDTYNSSPDAARAALETLAKLNIAGITRRVAVLGDMLELGDFTVESHKELGRQAMAANVDLLVCVGNFRRHIRDGAAGAGLAQDKIIEFADSLIASKIVSNIIQSGDLVLVKGSQASRMERVVRVLMKDQSQAEDLLVRQEESWKKNCDI